MGDSQVISLILLCFAGDPEVPFQPVRAEVRYVHDADTLNVDICLPFKVTLPNRTVRAWGYDAWETNRVRKAVKVTEAEIKKGLQARSEFMELLKEGVVMSRTWRVSVSAPIRTVGYYAGYGSRR